MRMLKVALFAGEFPILSETFVIRQVAGLVRAGCDVTVLVGKWGDRGCEHKIYRDCNLGDRVVLIRPDGASSFTRLILVLKFIFISLLSSSGRNALGVALSALFNGSRGSFLDIASVKGKAERGDYLGEYDVIISHFGPVGVRAMNLIKAGGLAGPLAVIFHGSDMSEENVVRKNMKSYKQLFAFSRKLLPISDLWRERLISWGAPPSIIEVQHMGVDVGEIKMLDPNRPIHHPIRILSVARFTEKKGLRYAIEGVIACKQPVHYQIIGGGELEDELKSLAETAGPDKRIEFLGKRSQQDVFSALATSDVFLLPSVTAVSGDMEGIPVALMEAMAMGVVVLSTAHSGIPELIQDQKSGYLVPERDSGAIARSIDKIVSETSGLVSLRQSARSKVEADFNNQLLDKRCLTMCAEIAHTFKGSHGYKKEVSVTGLINS